VGRRRLVDGVVLKEGVAVVLSLTSALRAKTSVDLVDDVGSVLDSLLAEMLESVTSGCTGEDLEDLIFKVAFVESLEIPPAEGALSSDQLVDLMGNAGLLMVGQFGDAGHLVKSTARGGLVGRRLVDGVILKEGVAVVLSLASSLGAETSIDLVEDVGSVLDRFLTEMLESVTSGCASEDLKELIVDELAFIESFVEIALLVVTPGLLRRH
jgi:hypothetical protein